MQIIALGFIIIIFCLFDNQQVSVSCAVCCNCLLSTFGRVTNSVCCIDKLVVLMYYILAFRGKDYYEITN